MSQPAACLPLVVLLLLLSGLLTFAPVQQDSSPDSSQVATLQVLTVAPPLSVGLSFA